MLALLVFPFFAYWLFNRFKKNPIEGAIWVFLSATLFLPERTKFDFPLVPPIGKHQLAAALALGMLWLRKPSLLRAVPPFRGVESLMLLFFLGAVLQVPANSEPVVWQAWPDDVVLLPLTYKDAISNIIDRALTYWLHFYLGRVVVQSSADLRVFLKTIVIGGFIYSFLSFIEQLMSPQLHIWIYGFHQHVFSQAKRMGGWRPTIFLVHGLNVALFMLTAANAAVTLARIKHKALKYAPRSLAIYQCIHVGLMKSTGAIIFGAATLPIAAVSSPRAQLKVCWALAAICAIYPASKVTDVFPREALQTFMNNNLPAERAESMETRFFNDEVLSSRGRERMWFGWGGFGRMEVFSPLGKQITIPDAQWIVLFGQMGLCGLITFFAVSLWPIFLASRSLGRFADPSDRVLVAGLAIMSITHTFDMLLNSMQNGLPMYLAGALLGLTEALVRNSRGRPGPAAAARAVRRPVPA
jgi:hypothetical protein